MHLNTLKKAFSSFLLFAAFISHAQIDTEFWLTVPEITAEHADAPISLHLSSASQLDGTVRVYTPAAAIL